MKSINHKVTKNKIKSTINTNTNKIYKKNHFVNNHV